MMTLEDLCAAFAQRSREILGEDLVGIYLHGSAVMGCCHPERSDVDLLVVVRQALSDEVKRRYMDMVVALNDHAPKKGIEMSVMRAAVCRPFVYPTPYELHFSNAHLAWYRAAPEDYIARMKGEDKDLAAHCTVLWHRGRALDGPPVREVFGEVPRDAYWDSLRYDIASAAEDIAADPMYVTFSLCRVLAYGQEGAILSKWEGGEWGLAHIPEKYHPLLRGALTQYAGGEEMTPDRALAAGFAAYMLEQIKTQEKERCT